jgi:dinuclear metal center YbgI/SA1388 family protein
MLIKEIDKFLKNLLDPMTMPDYAINGIQVENIGDIDKIGFTVDASVEAIKEALKNNCKLLVVHHGLFWSKINPITGNFRERVKMFLDNDIGLIAYHLPLDCHEDYGNNIQILKAIGYDKKELFANYKGVKIGWYCENNTPFTIEEIILNLKIESNSIKYFDFGNKEIRKIGVVSGGGNFAFDEAVNNKFDLFITGDAEHVIYHQAKENKINVLFAGHYFTETFGVKALRRLIEEKLNINSVFFDIPTGL